MEEYELAPLDESPRRPSPLQPIAEDGALPPVPFDPPHLCPVCQYNLAGLRHRTCPECGNEFDLREARSAATGGLGMFDGADLRVVRLARLKFTIGIVLLVIGYGVPSVLCAFHRLQIFILLLEIALPCFLIVVSSVASDWDWATVVLLWGMTALAIGGTTVSLMLL